MAERLKLASGSRQLFVKPTPGRTLTVAGPVADGVYIPTKDGVTGVATPPCEATKERLQTRRIPDADEGVMADQRCGMHWLLDLRWVACGVPILVALLAVATRLMQ